MQREMQPYRVRIFKIQLGGQAVVYIPAEYQIGVLRRHYPAARPQVDLEVAY